MNTSRALQLAFGSLGLCAAVATTAAAQTSFPTEGVVTASTLNVRATPNGQQIGSVDRGTRLRVTGQSGSWYAIAHSSGRTGYVFARHVQLSASSRAATPAASGNEVRVVTASRLNVRSGPGVGHSVVGSISQGTRVTVVSRRGGWAEIRTTTGSAWVSYNQLGPDGASGEGVGIIRALGGQSDGVDRGTLTPATRPAFSNARGAGRAIANPRNNQEQQFQHYARLAATVGGSIEAGADQRTVIGIRGVDPNGNVTPEATRNPRNYNDTFVVLWRDSAGNAHVETFLGSTTPGQAATRYSGTPDVDRDGTRDIAHIRPGVHAGYQRRTYKGRSAYGTWDTTPTYRDTNQDGRISDAEARASVRRGDLATGILFHRGNSNRPASVGCQTMSSTVFAQFERALGGDRRWDYILVDPR